jgi:hypothetical protein
MFSLQYQMLFANVDLVVIELVGDATIADLSVPQSGCYRNAAGK